MTPERLLAVASWRVPAPESPLIGLILKYIFDYWLKLLSGQAKWYGQRYVVGGNDPYIMFTLSKKRSVSTVGVGRRLARVHAGSRSNWELAPHT